MDLLGIVEPIAEDDPRAALLETLEKLESGAARLERFPRRGGVVPELLAQGITRHREVVIRPWRLVYRIEERQVHVLAVIDGRRNVEDVLLARLLR
jgi:toxin ParE1/3/4